MPFDSSQASLENLYLLGQVDFNIEILLRNKTIQASPELPLRLCCTGVKVISKDEKLEACLYKGVGRTSIYFGTTFFSLLCEKRYASFLRIFYCTRSVVPQAQ
jgi:hypothetical protein